LYNDDSVVCPLCGQRKARRACPALGTQICAVCCGTKRLVEIRCPNDCGYLATAREHPPAVAVRQQQRDVGAILRFMRDLDERQSRLFFLIVTFLVRYEPPELHAIIDEDVVEATAAIAATFETAARGVIYEHRPASLSGERLANELKQMLAEAGEQGGAAFRQDAAVVLRRVETAAREATKGGGGRRAFLDLAGRVTAHKRPESTESSEVDRAPRVIIP
jgi:hypothetical protein